MDAMRVLVVLAMALAATTSPVKAGVSFFEYDKHVNATTGEGSSSSTSAPPSTSPLPPSSTAAAEHDEHVETTTEDAEKEKDCYEQIGTIENGVPVNKMKVYDVELILEELGGAPGKLNASWNKDVPELAVEDPNKQQPLPDTKNSTYWLYDYRHSDFKTFVRLEHALLRNKGHKDEYVDVFGELYWTPPDFCGKVRHATYHSEPHKGFEAEAFAAMDRYLKWKQDKA